LKELPIHSKIFSAAKFIAQKRNNSAIKISGDLSRLKF
jgi:hypothetical protein